MLECMNGNANELREILDIKQSDAECKRGDSIGTDMWCIGYDS